MVGMSTLAEIEAAIESLPRPQIERTETRALTTDHHFEQEGFIRLL